MTKTLLAALAALTLTACTVTPKATRKDPQSVCTTTVYRCDKYDAEQFDRYKDRAAR